MPWLTLDEAITRALERNAALTRAQLETARMKADLAASRTRFFPSTSVFAQGSQLLTNPSIRFAEGSLGTFPNTGPIPATDTTIRIPKDFVGIVSASVGQPLTTEYKIYLQNKSSRLILESTKQEEHRQRLATIDDVRHAYYEVADAQSQLDSRRVSLQYYRETKRLAEERRKRETILESDLLHATSQLLQAQNSVSEGADQVDSASEKLNDLLGRPIHTPFRVDTVGTPDTDTMSREAAEAQAINNRPDIKKARLGIQQAEYDRRAKIAEYIPDISGGVSYYSTFNFGNTLPSNITMAGFTLTWEPWDWGRRYYEMKGKRAQVEEARVSESSTERSALREVSAAWRQLEDARRKLTTSEAARLAARQQLKEIQEQALREEKLPKDLFSAQSDLASADNQHDEALTGFWKARADLKKAIGEE